MSDVDALADVLKKQFGHVTYRPDFGWPNAPLNVIDAVLSLNRNYTRVVLPRVTRFSKRRANISELRQLRQLIDSYSEPVLFSVGELDYNDRRRAQTLSGVVDYMLEVQARYSGVGEMDRLRAWAIAVLPGDYVNVGISGFGLSGFQYMRMLLGAQTTKPDVHICRFVSEVLGRTVNDVTALRLLEQASARANLLLREVDGAIWSQRAVR